MELVQKGNSSVGFSLNYLSQALCTFAMAGLLRKEFPGLTIVLGGGLVTSWMRNPETLEFVVKHKDEINFLNLALFNMPVCGTEAGKFETRSFYEGDLSLYTDFLHPKGWDRKKVRQFIDNEFKKNKAVSEILKKDPPIFTSNHAPLFAMRQR